MRQIFRLATFNHIRTADVTFARIIGLNPLLLAKLIISQSLMVLPAIVTIFAAHSVAPGNE